MARPQRHIARVGPHICVLRAVRSQQGDESSWSTRSKACWDIREPLLTPGYQLFWSKVNVHILVGWKVRVFRIRNVGTMNVWARCRENHLVDVKMDVKWKLDPVMVPEEKSEDQRSLQGSSSGTVNICSHCPGISVRSEAMDRPTFGCSYYNIRNTCRWNNVQYNSTTRPRLMNEEKRNRIFHFVFNL